MTDFALSDEERIQITSDGDIVLLGQIVEEVDFLKQIYKNIRAKDHYFISQANHREFVIEAYDQILVIPQLIMERGKWLFRPVEDVEFEINLNELYLDDWDRLLGRTKDQIPFVLTDSAQEQVFKACDEYDDDSITFEGHIYPTPYYYQSNSSVNESSWWSAKYRENNKPGWDLEGHHPMLENAISTLKLNKSKILVTGSGKGHDAAFLAKQGHIVHGLDFSSEAITAAKSLYGEGDQLKWITADIFDFNKLGVYDLVFDHTSYCAIQPKRRNELVRKWHQFLRDGGHLLGIFFAMDKQNGPPFGGSEWELAKRCEKGFRPIYWNRLPSAPQYSRHGIEFMAYLQKVNS
tara:strand:+ start:9924 stop:10970 length:1047 start_codon:yes stop_codon:yes gene_type:complete